VEKVTYSSDGLSVQGQICRPDDAVPHALIMVNHGGFEGNGNETFTGNLEAESFCLNGARLGFVIAESSYRGEDDSEGDVEVCLGEVDDVVAMLDVMRREPYVDPDRVGAFGGSHGGCITTSLALREPTLRAAVDFFGPSDFSALTTWWHEQLDQDEPAPFCAPVLGTSPCTIVHQTLVGVLEGATGGPPSASTEAAYRTRSPIHRMGELKVPMAFFQGTDDYLVNLEQTCKKRAALTAAGKTPLSWYLDGAMTPRSPSGVCGGDFRTDPVPDTASMAAWSGDGPYVFIYEGQGHAITGAANTQATTIALRFLFAHLEP
jgi:dipeptidyl aminopeptidase/acylaminoacyl peptidase